MSTWDLESYQQMLGTTVIATKRKVAGQDAGFVGGQATVSVCVHGFSKAGKLGGWVFLSVRRLMEC